MTRSLLIAETDSGVPKDVVGQWMASQIELPGPIHDQMGRLVVPLPNFLQLQSAHNLEVLGRKGGMAKHVQIDVESIDQMIAKEDTREQSGLETGARPTTDTQSVKLVSELT